MANKEVKSDCGILYLVPNTLGGPASAAIPLLNASVIEKLRYFLAENPKRVFRSLRELGFTGDFEQVTISELSEHTESSQFAALLKPLLEGHDMGLISEAGLPAVADPGEEVIQLAHAQGITVVPLSGPCSISLALAASGLPAEKFSFCGYLSRESNIRRRELKYHEQLSADSGYTQIFIETPYRNQALLSDILASCRESTLISIACNLTMPEQWVKTKDVASWSQAPIEIGKNPCVFLISASTKLA